MHCTATIENYLFLLRPSGAQPKRSSRTHSFIPVQSPGGVCSLRLRLLAMRERDFFFGSIAALSLYCSHMRSLDYDALTTGDSSKWARSSWWQMILRHIHMYTHIMILSQLATMNQTHSLGISYDMASFLGNILLMQKLERHELGLGKGQMPDPYFIISRGIKHPSNPVIIGYREAHQFSIGCQILR